jgi:hypothetical protein
LKEELAEILDYLRGSEPYKTSYDSDVTPNVNRIIEAFNKILPEKIVLGETTTFNMNLEEVCRFDGSVEGYNQCVDQIERAINE